jgi:hypothetical protein
MDSQEGAPEEPQVDGQAHDEPEAQPDLRTAEELDAQAKKEVLGLYASKGLLLQGELNRDALAVQIYEGVKDRVVVKPGDRDKVYWTRSAMVLDLAGLSKAAAAETSDPPLAVRIYDIVDGDIWRLTSMDPDGPVQSQLNGEGILCRREVPRKEKGIYVTRNKRSLLEDFSAPQRKKIKAAMDKHSAMMDLAADRVPEHGTAFLNEFKNEAQDGLKAGTDRIKRTIDAGKDNGSDGDADEGGDE